MQFKVPQFIDREVNIIGSLTFKQFLFLAIGGGACMILFFAIAERSFFLWAILTVTIMGISAGLAFLQVGNIPIYMLILKSFDFLMKPKIYIWKKKTYSPKFIPLGKEIDKKEIDKKDLGLKTAEKSRIKKLWTEIELK